MRARMSKLLEKALSKCLGLRAGDVVEIDGKKYVVKKLKRG